MARIACLRHASTPCALAVSLFVASLGGAQTLPPSGGELKSIDITDRTAAAQADVTGFGDVPARELPMSTTVIDREQIDRTGARRLADLTALDASVTDSYNAPGYWDFLNVRGYTLDPRYNYRREGLPISAETVIPLDNKQRIEVLKGTSGIQAGTSAPGGLVNYVVKRPTETPVREVTLGTGERGSRLVALDLGGRTDNKVIGYRLNIAHEDLRPLIHSANGERSLVAFATDARLSRDTLLSAEFEWSKQTQPSVPGMSLLGNQLPAVGDPRTNLNNQSWSQPNRFHNFTGTVKLEQALNSQWNWSAQYGAQNLRTDDHLAYPFGCYDAASDTYYADRYCPATTTGKANVGLADVYDYRSENERRRLQALQFKLQGSAQLAGVPHQLSVGLLRSVLENRFGFQTDDSAAVGQVSTDGATQVPAANPPLAYITPNTNRDERATELFVQDVARWTPRFSTWAGLRHTQLDRHAIRTDGSRETRYSQSFTTPWIGASYELFTGISAYGSWGRGVESEVVPGRSRYVNAGVALPALESTQKEIGLKGLYATTQWQVAYFDIRRPITSETQLVGTLSAAQIAQLCPASPDDCRLRGFDGDAHHRGLEAAASTRWKQWTLAGSAMALRAVRNSLDPALDGHTPVNVPRWVLRAQADYRVASVPGLSLGGAVVHEGTRKVVDNASEQVTLPSWTRLDASIRYQHKLSPNTQTTWLLSVENLLDRTYWRESPTSYGHIYLYPGAPRTLRLTMKTSF